MVLIVFVNFSLKYAGRVVLNWSPGKYPQKALLIRDKKGKLDISEVVIDINDTDI